MIAGWKRKLKTRKRLESEAEMNRAASTHYQRGNRYFEARDWEPALKEWRRSTELWQVAKEHGRRMASRLIHLRAALAFLVTIILVYTLIFSLLPRSRWELMLMSGGQQQVDTRSWWERFLDSGRAQSGSSGHKIGVREWWQSFQRSRQGNRARENTRARNGRTRLDERWEKLLRRYGRSGPFYSSDLDVNLISGYGLSRLGDYAHSVETFEQGAQKTSRPEKLADLFQGLANAHYYKGYQLQKDGLAKYDLELVKKSLKAYEQSVAYQPRAISYGNLGWMYFLVKDYEKAGEFSRRAIVMNPSLEYVRLNLGLIYVMQDRVYDAYDVYINFMERNPAKEVYLGGVNDLLEIIRDHPGRYPFAHLFVGLLSLKQGNFEMARESLRRFLLAPYVGRTWKELATRNLRLLEMPLQPQ